MALGLVTSTALVASVPALAGATTQYPAQSAAFASKVLDEAILPPGSQETTTAVTHMVAMEASPIRLHGGDTTYDADQLYTVPTAPATVVTYIEHHLPKGWKVGFTEPPNGPPPPGDTIIQVQVPVTGPHEETATVSYTVVPDGTGTEYRIDALVIWLPSRPHGLTAPQSGSILVTGYTTSNLMGNPQKSTKVRVSGRKAEAIRRAFNVLPLSTPPRLQGELQRLRTHIRSRPIQGPDVACRSSELSVSWRRGRKASRAGDRHPPGFELCPDPSGRRSPSRWQGLRHPHSRCPLRPSLDRLEDGFFQRSYDPIVAPLGASGQVSDHCRPVLRVRD